MVILQTRNMTVTRKSVIILAVSLCGSNLHAISAQEVSAAAYDPTPFLSAMTTLRAAAETCDPFVAGGPVASTSGIKDFFESLGQPLPDLVDSETQVSLGKFVGSQAAVLCREKIDVAVAAYRVQAEDYLNGKPDNWPVPPEVTLKQMCSTENCFEF